MPLVMKNRQSWLYSDPQICHRKHHPPLASPETALYCLQQYRDEAPGPGSRSKRAIDHQAELGA